MALCCVIPHICILIVALVPYAQAAHRQSNQKISNVGWKCRQDQLDCGENDRCIPIQYMCDTNIDCVSGIDEVNCMRDCSGKNQFQCKDEVCISKSSWCDLTPDCPDQSDENACPTVPGYCDGENVFICQNGPCLSKRKICDGIVDCPLGDDEKGCNIQGYKCLADQFDCGDMDQCIPDYFVCDMEKDCNNGRDEPEFCPSDCSGRNQFKCDDGTCIASVYRNDWPYEPDCDDESDESLQGAIDFFVTCSGDNHFKCGDGNCTALTYVCNHRRDCKDGSDELNCHFGL